ncbi:MULTISPECIES: acid-sensing system DNA-binding response regulator EvgA [Yersinia]|jgi:two-component system response regulator EvgA|uniref:Two-component response regulator n=2 Tax=Yersinia TaxID=629 RepID=A0AAI9EPH9_YERFR|nr:MULTISPECIES: acid-sensing system DNA-binding response regulator EvgA [Yersinia]ATM87352.1 DNA-binding response regulator [Yersinia frederiksenii]AVX36844.1 DNA-binding response regulator [Yersinia massiliensis]MCB5317835.1 acid-sensing system DNA-binding response regulator EvgA [Yersinia massiliensis]MDN0127508.1 acid-sensing system DNA-binding response regulator EvgA [Yersinia massiliensis]QKJ11646.1 acid-sensing system DNA-binding response regulator EvgA [Yersinia massiliensis]
MKAIIIDNHPLARAVIRNLLENAGVNVLFESDNGAEALKLMKNAQPDVVILDADMPRLSGIEVIVKLRKKRYIGIIIVVSANNDLFYSQRSADAGANAFISKKHCITDIIPAIEAAQKGYSYFPFISDELNVKPTSEKEKLDLLSMQEIKVMRYILDSLSTMSIASEMRISSKTVSTYKSRLMDKLECKTLMDLFSFARRNKIC